MKTWKNGEWGVKTKFLLLWLAVRYLKKYFKASLFFF